ncbi:MAG: response regulator [Phycisphaerales bacterium]|nr:response regulator [Phycisphaerales bacterium]
MPTILMVSEDAARVATMTDWLRQQGYAVVTARDAGQALVMVSETVPDLILLEMQSDGRRGVIACRRLKADLRLSGVPIVVLTGDHDMTTIDEAVAAGAKDYIVETLPRSIIASRLCTALRNEGGPFELSHTYERARREVHATTIQPTELLKQLNNEILDRRRAENKCSDTMERLRNILDCLPEVILQMDAQMRILWANRAALERNPKAHGLVCYKAMFGRDKMCPGCPCVRSSQTGRMETNTVHHAIPAGEHSWWEVIGIPLAAGQGGGGGTIVVARNVTSRVEAERVVRESEQRLQTIMQSVQVGVIIADADNMRIVDANMAALRILRGTREQVIGRPYDRHTIAVDMAHDTASNTGEDLPDNERVLVTLTGDRLAVWVNVVPITLNGRPHLLESIVDISDRKKAEEQLAIFRKFAEASGQGLSMADLNGDITYVNPALIQLLGEEDASAILGRDMFEFYPQSVRHRVREEIVPMVFQQGHWTGELPMQGRELVQTLQNLVLLRGERNEPICVAQIVTDISGIEDTAKQLRRSNMVMVEALRREKCASMQLEAALEQLEAARMNAEDASLAKSEFLANMSHEIRTPMNGIVGLVDILHRTELDHTQRRYLGMIQQSTDSLLQIINDVLDLSKVEAGKLELDVATFDLRECVRDSLALFVIRAEDKGITLSSDIAPSIPKVVEGDAGRLRQILLNLLGNAIKFTDKGGVRLEVKPEDPVMSASDGGLDVLFAVVDTGMGIPQDQQKMIFEAFSQADRSVTRRFGGTGLGLTITSRLVDLMGGRIWVDSEPGKGSTFYFKARFGVTKPGEASLVNQTRPRMTGGSITETGPCCCEKCQDIRPMRILLAEDNLVNQQVACLMLREMGHDVVVVGDGRAACEALDAAGDPYDLVLMDIQMPVMNGLEATTLIRQTEAGQGRRQPIIAMTAYAMQGDRERCLAAGMNDYISKPIKAGVLIELLAKWSRRIDKSCSGPKVVSQGRVGRDIEVDAGDEGAVPTAPIDIPTALDNLAGNQRILARVVDLFQSNVGKTLGELEAAYRAGDAALLKVTAHGLKGAAANICAESIRRTAECLEQQAAENQLDEVEELIGLLARHVDELCQYLATRPVMQIQDRGSTAKDSSGCGDVEPRPAEKVGHFKDDTHDHCVS